MDSQCKVAIFWDFENCAPSCNIRGFDIVHNIRQIAHHYGTVTLFKAYLDLSEQSSLKTTAFRSELQSCGVSLTDCPHNGKKDVSDKMMIVDMLTYAIDTPAPATLVLISGDRDFVYAVSVLLFRRYRVVLIAPSNAHSSLRCQATVIIDWDSVLQPRSDAPNSLPSRPRAHSSVDLTKSSPFKKAARRLSFRDPVTIDGLQPAAEIESLSEKLPREPVISVSATPPMTDKNSLFIPPVTPITQSLDTPIEAQNVGLALDLAEPVDLNYHLQKLRGSSKDTVDNAPLSSNTQPRLNDTTTNGFADSFDRSFDLPTTTQNNFDAPTATQALSRPVSAPANISTDDPSTIIPPQSPDNDNTPCTLPLAQTPARYTPAPLGVQPYARLLRILEALLSGGVYQPSQSEVSLHLMQQDREAYTAAGVQGWDEYVTNAVRLGLVTLGGSERDAWISLSTSPVTCTDTESEPDTDLSVVPSDTLTNPIASPGRTPSPSSRAEKIPKTVSAPSPVDSRPFERLIQVLLAYKEAGVPQPSRSTIAAELMQADSNIFTAAGFTRWKDYAAAAEKRGVILLGGMQAGAWVSLTPSYHPMYSPLLQVLEGYQEVGMKQPLRSAVAISLVNQYPDAYTNAGVNGWKEYVAMAQDEGLVLLGGMGGYAWISLNSGCA